MSRPACPGNRSARKIPSHQTVERSRGRAALLRRHSRQSVSSALPGWTLDVLNLVPGSARASHVVRRALAANTSGTLNDFAQFLSHKCQQRGRRWLHARRVRSPFTMLVGSTLCPFPLATAAWRDRLCQRGRSTINSSFYVIHCCSNCGTTQGRSHR